MANSAHARPSGERRTRLPLPPVLLELPMGLRPSAAFRHRDRAEVDLVYPGDVGLRLDLVRRRVVEVRPGRAAPEAARRLGAAVQARWFRCAPVRRWLDRVAALVAEPEAPEAREVREAREARVPPESAAFRTAREMSLERTIWQVTRIARGQPVEPAAPIEQPAAALIRAWAMSISGRGASGEAVVESLGVRGVVDPRHALARGLFAALLERPDAAIEPLSLAVHLLGQGRESLLGVATQLADRDATLLALDVRLGQASPGPAERGRLVQELLAGDASSEALRFAEHWFERVGDGPSYLELAELELYRGRTERARTLAGSVAEASTRRERILAGCDVLEGHHRDALERLGSVDPDEDPQVNLWLAQAQIELRDGRAPRRALERVRFTSQPAVHLLEGLHDLGKGRLKDDARQVYPRVASHLGAPARGEDRDSLRQAGRKALARLGGNRSAIVTTVDERRQLHRFRLLPPRVEYEQLQRQLLHAPVESVLETFSARRQADPGLPYPYTYGAELLLWTGEYERARDLLIEAWDRFETRWAYVGAGAAEALMGRHDAALEWWTRGDERFEMLDAEASWAYRGESWRRVGELDRAVADLEHALRHRPGRHGSRIDLARTHLQAGRIAAARNQLHELARAAPVLMAEARLDAGVGEGPIALDDLEPGSRGEVLARAAHMLRGNRSSKLLTFIDRAGELRVFAEAHVERWMAVAQRVGFLPEDVALERRLAEGG